MDLNVDDLVCPACHGAFRLRDDLLDCQSCEETMIRDQGVWIHRSNLMEKFNGHALSGDVPQYADPIPAPANDFYSNFVTNQPDRYLDAGCGDGNGSAYYAERYPDCQVFALDADLFALHKYQRRHLQNVHTVGCSVTSTPFKDGFFDHVNSVFVVEHMAPDVLSSFLGEVYRLLRPGGVFVVASDSPFYDKFIHPVQRLAIEKRWRTTGWTNKDGTGHVNLMTARTMEGYLLEHGFQLSARRIHYVAGRHKWARAVYSSLPQGFVERFCSTMYILTAQRP